MVKTAKAANPDAFVAWSYPPDTFGLADQAKIENLNVKAYYCAIGCAFQGFSQKNGAAIENVLGVGGVTTSPEIRAFYKKHKEITGIDADYAGSPQYLRDAPDLDANNGNPRLSGPDSDCRSHSQEQVQDPGWRT